MNPLQIRLLSLAAFAVFCATATWWTITLATNRAAPVQAAAARAPVSLDQAGTLFGGRLERNPVQDIHLFGILALAQGAAAIVSVGGEPPRAISLGGPIDQNSKLFEVRPRSIVIDRHGVHSEIFLPPNAAGPTIYVR
ncbi:general secretion pathway protein GspC [Paraburkholderia guartelaensis]|jgi:general secretion pathway protein C|uniref:General secretion pathway protein GspC n=1 Tax=Paraburkholderia guartelaensis TaxID=2546446 RepID=A0A4R5LFU0_9BURK|nr:general secretion pathway protein GspC [Paraburkholderia guartelaensis]TDG07829.1 general secretion pathway protein GspC [Paraburkholderia guartelaensis]